MKRFYGGHSFESSNEDKPLFPDGGPTKGRVIDYYERIAETMLPHLRDRPLVMRRCPDGIEADCFYQKQIGKHFPDWIDRVRVDRRGDGGAQTLVVARDRATLAYLAQQAVVTMHVWLSHRDRLDHPDQLVVDLDPPGDDFGLARRAALWCRELLRELGLDPLVKTTGSTGLHLVVVLDGRSRFEDVRDFARAAMSRLVKEHPDELTTEVRKDKRGGRLYLDVTRNAYAQTVVAPYSLRAKAGAPVATPLGWSELRSRRVHARTWTIDNIFRRLGQRDDPWSDFRLRACSLEAARQRLRRV